MSGVVPALEVQRFASAACPTNGQVGRRVDVQTVKALLNLPLTVLRNTEYRFCPDPNCPTVYYSADGSQAFVETDLRERVYQKHPQDGNVFVCYCFRHTVGEIHTDGESVATEINQGIQKDQCACDIRNPQGSCCLGNVKSLVKNKQTIQ